MKYYLEGERPQLANVIPHPKRHMHLCRDFLTAEVKKVIQEKGDFGWMARDRKGGRIKGAQKWLDKEPARVMKAKQRELQARLDDWMRKMELSEDEEELEHIQEQVVKLEEEMMKSKAEGRYKRAIAEDIEDEEEYDDEERAADEALLAAILFEYGATNGTIVEEAMANRTHAN
jgi:hypothetical protein